MELDSICEYILKKITKSYDGEYYDLYPYFTLENGELLSDCKFRGNYTTDSGIN